MERLTEVLRAVDAAARWHADQKRKGAASEPYVNHLIEVAMLVAQATEGTDPELVMAAMLHDAIEDQEVPRDLIAEMFAESVAALVEEVTDDKTLPKEERKLLQVDHAGKLSPRAKILKLADKTSNLKSIGTSPPEGWSVERRLDYVMWARGVATGLRGVSPWLENQFDEAALEAEQSLTLQNLMQPRYDLSKYPNLRDATSSERGKGFVIGGVRPSKK
jgi:GTP diphosphokinase / guanosine-3',5'-bis(diphosphate) 3'-diphosphatase